MQIVKVSADRISECLALAQSIAASAVGEYLTETGADSVTKFLQTHAPECTWFTAENKGICAYDEDASRIIFLGVAADSRRSGIGTALLDAVRDCAEQNHQARISANALGDAIDFYRNYGFDLAEEITEAGGLKYAPVEYLLGKRYLGTTVKIVVDRPFGSLHPHIADLEYELNFGYVSGSESSDGDFQDAWVYGVDEPVDTFTGTVIGIIYHKDGVSRLIAAPTGRMFRKEDVIAAVGFEEQYFDTRIIWASSMN